ncbi:hypothetical protein KIPB_008341 [Kipferlia bialata]|uniref:Uncharacterized protein n=1 Tax=Kipferlia bialata TaxID=797122 RepID=A0A9K3CZV6_9EUKA|nr:hypothetical protein KIPB_008341 [Kipferlia bialata]|eukprot:g8341.t1
MATLLTTGVRYKATVSAAIVTFDLDAKTYSMYTLVPDIGDGAELDMCIYSMYTLVPDIGDGAELGAISMSNGLLALSVQRTDDTQDPSIDRVQLYTLEHDTPSDSDKWTLQAEARSDICTPDSPVPFCGTGFGAYVSLSPPTTDGLVSAAVHVDHCISSELVIDDTAPTETGCVVMMDIVQPSATTLDIDQSSATALDIDQSSATTLDIDQSSATTLDIAQPSATVDEWSFGVRGGVRALTGLGLGEQGWDSQVHL